ncbi:hypothetical protein COOONC_11269 [Cooperia oncophora]
MSKLSRSFGQFQKHKCEFKKSAIYCYCTYDMCNMAPVIVQAFIHRHLARPIKDLCQTPDENCYKNLSCYLEKSDYFKLHPTPKRKEAQPTTKPKQVSNKATATKGRQATATRMAKGKAVS